MGKTKTADVFPYAKTLVIRPRACRADVPLDPRGAVVVITIGALLNVTVDVSVLREVDNGVVLELLKGTIAGVLGTALDTAEDNGNVDLMTDELGASNAEELSRLLDVVLDATLDVTLIGIDEGVPGSGRPLPMTEDSKLGLEGSAIVELNVLDNDRVLTILDVVLIKTDDDAPTGVALLLDEVLNAMTEVVRGGVPMMKTLVEPSGDDIDVVKILLEVVEAVKPGTIRVVVIREPTTSEVLAIAVDGKIEVTLASSEDSVSRVPIVELEFPVGTTKLAVEESGLGADVLEGDVDKLARPLDSGPVEDDGIELAKDRMSEKDDGYETPGSENEDVPWALDVPRGMFDRDDDGKEMTVWDEGTSTGVVTLGVESGAEGSSVLLDDVVDALGPDTDEPLEVGRAGDVVAVIIVI